MKLSLNNSQVEKCLKNQYLGEQASWVRCYGLEKLGLKEGQYLGQAESDSRIYNLYAYKNDGSLVRCHNQSQWIIKLEGLENEADRLEKLEIAKWLLSKGVISQEQALEEYGYKE
jgi:hypothetical protein